MFQLLPKKVPVDVYMINQIMLQNIINSPNSSMLEFMYGCREQVNNEMENSIFLTKRMFNAADALKKKRANFTVQSILCSKLVAY